MSNFSTIEEILKDLDTNIKTGLSGKEAEKRLDKFGRNEIIKKRKFSSLKILFSQFVNFLIIILILASIVSFVAGKTTTGFVILAIVVLNVFLGFFMEYRAEKSIAALKKMLVSVVRVVRNNKERLLETFLLVPGDIIILQEGMKVPADARILEAVNLEVNEAALTGESMPVVKNEKTGKEPKKENIVFMGTIIVRGYGKAVILKTGMSTEFGKIAGMLSEVKESPSPLRKQIAILAKKIAMVACLIVFLILLTGVIKGIPLFDFEQLMVSLSLFVAVVPEGLLVVLTLALALSVHQMARQKTIIRRLSAVETLGCTQIICTDKTGTLTKNEMVIRKIWTGEKEFNIGEKNFDYGQSLEIPVFLKIGVLCNNAEVYPKEEGEFEILGDPTEASLLVLGEKAGIKEQDLKSRGKFLVEFSFDQKLKRRTVVWQENKKIELLTVGAPETVLSICSKFLKQNQEINLLPVSTQKIINTYQLLASQGYRMLGLAYKKLFLQNRNYKREEIEKDLVFVGLAAIYDPPRPEAFQAIKTCREAGIRTIMITGDNELTALSIAKAVGLVDKGERVISGREIDKMKDKEFF